MKLVIGPCTILALLLPSSILLLKLLQVKKNCDKAGHLRIFKDKNEEDPKNYDNLKIEHEQGHKKKTTLKLI